MIILDLVDATDVNRADMYLAKDELDDSRAHVADFTGRSRREPVAHFA